MGAGSSRDSEERERGSFQDWDRHGYSREVPEYQSYPPPPQTYDPPSESYPPPGSRPRPTIDRRYSRISDNYHTLEQVFSRVHEIVLLIVFFFLLGLSR